MQPGLNNTGLLLEHFSRLAAHDTATTAALVVVLGVRKGWPTREAAYGLTREQITAIADIDAKVANGPTPTIVPDMTADSRFDATLPLPGLRGFRFLAHVNLLSSGGERVGYLCVLDAEPRSGLSTAQTSSLLHIAEIVIADRKREQRHLHLLHVADRALRQDRMIRAVSEARTCADALGGLIEEMTEFHGAAQGRIWQLITPEQPIEISRSDVAHRAEGMASLPDQAGRLGDIVSEAIRRNRPQVVRDALADLGGAPEIVGIAAPSFCCVCVPVWVHLQRFGISLSWALGDADLDLVAADVSSLVEAVRPVLLRKAGEERVHFAAHHDVLTGLPNRLMFQERLQRAFVSARSNGDAFALMALDLDGFKLVNDTRGHDIGDRLLMAFADRLRESVRDTDTVARIGGDEFAIIQHHIGDSTSTVALAARLIEMMASPFDLGGRLSLVGLSMGIALFPQHGDTPDTLLRNADLALYRAKESGRNTFRVYSSEVQRDARDLFPSERELEDAIDGRRLTLAFQPICDIVSRNVVALETLSRWNHPIMGWIEPARFIPLAESSGLIHLLGRKVLEAACEAATAWDESVRLSVNLSPSQFRRRGIADDIREVLDITGLSPTRLELEVTEGFLLEDTEQVARLFQQLQAYGIRIILDDFGTAYANLDYLRRFVFDGVKIDKSFISQLGEDRNSVACVEAILSLCKRLNLTAVAEGVETELQLQILRDLGCELVQGYLIGKPCKRPKVTHHI